MLRDTKAVVTGGGSGIGLAIAKRLAGLGASVAIGGRRGEVIEQATREASQHGLQLRGHPLDVACRRSVGEFFEWVNREQGPTQLLVQAAGVNIRQRSMAEMSPEQWDQVLAINATGAYNCLAAVLPNMRQQQSGLVVLISSVAGKRAIALGGVAYCASKFAMTALGTAVANEVLEEGVRITNVYPGEVDTPILDNRPQPVTAEHRQRILQPEDVADLVAAIAQLPARAHVPEVVIKPTGQGWY